VYLLISHFINQRTEADCGALDNEDPVDKDADSDYCDEVFLDLAKRLDA
jgi:hypothetical protein